MSREIYTEENYQKFTKLFKSNEYAWGKPIEDSGYLDKYGKFYINYSTILTRLIQEAGRYCEHWASDLFIDWSGIDRKLQDGTMETTTHLFGFREDGVDHVSYIFNKCESYNCYGMSNDYYRSIWKLDIKVTEDDYYGARIKMILYRTSIPMRSDLKWFFDNLKKEAEDGISVPDKESVES